MKFFEILKLREISMVDLRSIKLTAITINSYASPVAIFSPSKGCLIVKVVVKKISLIKERAGLRFLICIHLKNMKILFGITHIVIHRSELLIWLGVLIRVVGRICIVSYSCLRNFD